MITFGNPDLEITIQVHTDGDFNRAEADYDLSPGQLFGLDTESTSLTPKGVFDSGYRLRLVQIATEHVAHVFDMEDPVQREYVRDVLGNLDNSFCAHTNIDTLAVWRKLDVNIALRLVDTRMLASMASPSDMAGGNDLKTLASKWLGPWLKAAQQRLGREDKFDWDSVDQQDEAYVIYAGLDAVACRRLVPMLIREAQCPASLLQIETWADAQACMWKMRGYRIDQEKHAALLQSTKEHCEQHAQAFGAIVYEEILKAPIRNPHYVQVPVSPRSGKKVAAFLRAHGADFIGFPLTDKGKELAEAGELTYEQEQSGEFASLAKKHGPLLRAMPLDDLGVEALNHLLAFKEKQYTQTKMEEIEKVMVDGRVHPTLRTIGAVTGRMSSSGPNFQNFGKKAVEMREIVIPDPGNVFVAADFDQIELRVIAALANVRSMIQTILDGEDLHDLTAALASVERQLAKIVNFLIVYGGGAKALQEQTGIPIKEAKEVIASYKAAYPEIANYSDEQAQFEDVIRPISLRKIPVGTARDKDGRVYSRAYANVNYKVQGSARELAVAAWWRYQHDPERKGEVVMIIHDELIVECPLEFAEQEKERLERCMSMDFMGVPISAGGAIMADVEGVSRWTSVDAAEAYAKVREETGQPVLAAV